MKKLIPEIGLDIGNDMTLEVREWTEGGIRELYRARVTQPMPGGEDRLVVSVTIRATDLHALPVVARALVAHDRARAAERTKPKPAEPWDTCGVESGA